MGKIRHVLGISGGKDSAALAIYLREKYPSLNIDYYYCDTGKELDETYQLIESLKSYLGKPITTLTSLEAKQFGENPFDFYYKAYRGYLPSSVARWCTKKMKLEPFEQWVGTDAVLSYVGIRGDEDREGYISTKKNIQSIFPFRKNIWSEDIINKVLANDNMQHLVQVYTEILNGKKFDKVAKIISEPLLLTDRNYDYNRKMIQEKLHRILDMGTIDFNRAVFNFLKGSDYPIGLEEDYPLLENDEILVRDDIFNLLNKSGVGIPDYYKKLEYDVDGAKGEYARSRSGCYFCFYQQKIEWIWLYEQHPDLFEKAKVYENEKEGFTWNQDESLDDIIKPGRIEQIKKEHLTRKGRDLSTKSPFLLDILDDTESHGCTACFT